MTATKVSKKDLIQEELEQILKADPQEMLRAEAVVEFARDNIGSALHSKFPWDDADAARLKRLDIARGIIRIYRIVVDEKKPEPFRAYVSLTTDRVKGGGYRPAMSVLNHEEHRKQLLADAYKVMSGFMKKYGTLTELAEVFAAIDRVLHSKDKGITGTA